MKFSTITKRRGLFNINLCSAFESECYSVVYDETILFDNEIYLHNETNLFWEKFHCDIRILYSCFFAVPQGAKSGDPYPQWICSFAPEIWKALWHKGFCKRKKHDSCNTNGIITIVLIWVWWQLWIQFTATIWQMHPCCEICTLAQILHPVPIKCTPRSDNDPRGTSLINWNLLN